MSNFVYPYDQFKLHNRSDPSRPLTFMLFWACWQMDNGETWPFHLASIFLHALAALFLAVLAGQLARRMGFPAFLPALVSSLWFLTLPLNAGTVIYAYGVSDVMATTFMLAALLFIFDRTDWMAISAAMVLYIMALASKQSAIVLPGLVVVIDYFTSTDFSFIRRRMRLYLTMAVVSLAYLGSRFWYFGRIGDVEAYDQFRVMIYLPLQGIMHWNYVARIFLPINLSIEHAHNPSMFTYPQCYLTWTMIGLAAFLSFRYGRSSRWLALTAMGWVALFLALSPTSTFFTTTDLFVERRAYTPSAFALLAWGTMLGGGLALTSVVQRRVWGSILMALLAFNIWITRGRMEVYGDEEKLWGETLKLYPRDERAMVNLATHFLRYEDFVKTKKVLDTLLTMYPGYYSGLINMGAYYQHPRNPERNMPLSHEYYKQALAQEPNNLSTLMNGGLLMMDMHDLPQARIYFGRMIELNPKLAQAHFGLARVEYMAGNRAKSLEHVRETLRLAPHFTDAQKLLKTLE